MFHLDSNKIIDLSHTFNSIISNYLLKYASQNSNNAAKRVVLKKKKISILEYINKIVFDETSNLEVQNLLKSNILKELRTVSQTEILLNELFFLPNHNMLFLYIKNNNTKAAQFKHQVIFKYIFETDILSDKFFHPYLIKIFDKFKNNYSNNNYSLLMPENNTYIQTALFQKYYANYCSNNIEPDVIFEIRNKIKDFTQPHIFFTYLFLKYKIIKFSDFLNFIQICLQNFQLFYSVNFDNVSTFDKLIFKENRILWASHIKTLYLIKDNFNQQFTNKQKKKLENFLTPEILDQCYQISQALKYI